MAMKKTRTTKVRKTMNKAEEVFRVSGKGLLKKVKELIAEGNVREIAIRGKDGKTIVVIPLTLGVVGGILMPPLVVVGTIAALVTECTIEVKRRK